MKIESKRLKSLAHDYRVTDGSKFQLNDFEPADTGKIKSEEEATEALTASVQTMSRMQEKLYAQDRWAVLLIFQAMDAAGKDGTIKHVMSGINPQGCQVTSFKQPSIQEQDHDFLWRSNLVLPERGRIGIFNRSYYEETLVVRLHKNLLKAEKIPDELRSKHIWKERFQDINAYERYLSRNGVVIRKFFLHLSKGEQKRRFLARLEQPSKNWKFSEADLKERAYWDDYQEAYEDMIRHTATPYAPWYVVPADNKWFTRLVVATAVIDTLKKLKLEFPKLTTAQRETLHVAREMLSR